MEISESLRPSTSRRAESRSGVAAGVVWSVVVTMLGALSEQARAGSLAREGATRGYAHTATIGPELPNGAVIKGPFGVSILEDGAVLVSDDLGHQVYRLSPGLDRAVTLSAGLGLAYPDAAVPRPGGGLALVDTGNNRLLFLTPAGSVERTWRRWSWLSGGFSSPRSLHFRASGEAVVADWGSHRVLAFDARGNLARALGRSDESPGPGPGEFDRPISALFVSGLGILVSDHRNHRLQLATRSGYRVIGRPGAQPGAALGEFHHPSGLALGPSGAIYVAEQGNRRIQRLSAKAAPEAILDSRRLGVALGRPTDVAVSESRLAIADAERHVVWIFDAETGPQRADAPD